MALTAMYRRYNLFEKSRLFYQFSITFPKVFLKKLNSVGANFAVKKTSEKKEFATQLWSLLLSNASITREIPDRVGWHKNSDGEIKFHEEGTLVWKFLIEIILKNS